MRTTITFGGAEFSIQTTISSGVRARIGQERAELKREKLKEYEPASERARMQTLARQCVQEVLDSEDAKKLPGVSTYILNRVVPVLSEAWKEEWLQENYPYDYTLIILRNILKPESETSVQEAFDVADVKEVEYLMTFFTGNADGKTSDGEHKVTASRRTKKSKTANP